MGYSEFIIHIIGWHGNQDIIPVSLCMQDFIFLSSSLNTVLVILTK